MHATTPRHTLHKLSLSGCVLSVCLAAARAEAAPEDHPPPTGSEPRPRFGSRGQWVFSADDLVQATYRADPTVSAAYLSADGTPIRQSMTGHTWSLQSLRPTVGVDLFAARHLSVGVGATYDQSTNASSTATVPTSTGSLPSYVPSDITSEQTDRRLGIGPRVGLAYSSESGVGVWGRAALNTNLSWRRYAVVATPPIVGTDESTSGGSLVLRLSAALTYSPVNHVLLTLGPSLGKAITTWQTSSVQSLGATPVTDFPIVWGLDAGAAVFL